jgi:hypothetical protein
MFYGSAVISEDMKYIRSFIFWAITQSIESQPTSEEYVASIFKIEE